MSLARSIRAWRRRWGLKQSAAAAALGVNVYTLQNWEQGRSKPHEFARRALQTKLQHPPS